MAIPGTMVVMEGPNFNTSLFSATEAFVVARARARQLGVLLLSPADVNGAVRQRSAAIGGHVVLAAARQNQTQ